MAITRERVDRRPPFQIAADIRQQMKNSIRVGAPLRCELDPNVAACLTGIPANILRETNLSTLIRPQPNGVTFLVADDETIVQEAVQVLYHRGKGDKVARNRFNITMYLSVYELIQATLLGKGKRQLQQGLTKFFLATLEEESEDGFLVGLAPIIQAKETIPELDQITLHQTLTFLWEKIPQEIRETYASFKPENLFRLAEY